MRRRHTLVGLALLLAPGAAPAQFRQEPSSIDHNQAWTIRSAATLFCLQIHQDHRAGRTPDDCVMIDSRTMEARVAPPGAEQSWTHHLAIVWCEGNRYTDAENRFQVRGEQSCEQLCDRSEEDRACITKADIGRAARREPTKWYNVGAFRLVELPKHRAPRCTEDEEHAEAWRVIVLEMDARPGARRAAPMPYSGDLPTTFHVVCPDGIELPEGARFRARATTGDACLPWSSPGGEPCLTGIEPIAEPVHP